MSGQLTAYMLVNNAGDLALMGGSADAFGVIRGNFALGRDVDATGFTGLGDVTFDGLFDGNGGLGVNYTISNLTLTAHLHSFDSIGLLPFIGTDGVVRNFTLANVSITTAVDDQFIGAVAGTNNGKISNVHVLSGTINGESHAGIQAGGLVGQNNPGGTIVGSSANVAVTVGDTADQNHINMAGGLFSVNLGRVFQSFATGTVTAGANSWAGGLGAANFGSLDQVFALGSVAGGGNSLVGGLAAINSLQGGSAGLITNTYAIGPVSGGTNSAVGGLVAENVSGAAMYTSFSAGPVS